MNPVLIRTLWLSLFGLLIAAISGCTTISDIPDTLHIKQIDQLTIHQKKLEQLNDWQLKGRIALNYNGESWNASIHWQKFAERYDIQLYLPLGQGSMQLTGNTNGAVLKTSDGEFFEAGSSEELFLQQFGLIFPVSSLQDWVIGRPANNAENYGDWLQRVDEHGQMLSLEQNLWDLKLAGYRPISHHNEKGEAETIPLPRKIFLSQNGNSVRLVVQQWQLNDQTD